jgi:hypothetical protein
MPKGWLIALGRHRREPAIRAASGRSAETVFGGQDIICGKLSSPCNRGSTCRSTRIRER